MRKGTIRAFNEIKSAANWVKDKRAAFGLNKNTLKSRLRCGHSPELAIIKPVITKYNKRYEYNHDYFSKWTYENAWIIGFITADGNVRNNTLYIQLSKKDVCILEHIRDKISPEKKIFFTERVDGFDKSKRGHSAYIQIISAQIVKDLYKYHIVPRKTGKEKLPKFPNKRIAYRYLLGLIDGDGCITSYKDKSKPNTYNRQVSLCSANLKFLKSIQKYFGFDNNISKYKNKQCWRLTINKKEQLINLYNNLYNTEGFCLERKKAIFTNMLNIR